jgi:hypothetical protein
MSCHRPELATSIIRQAPHITPTHACWNAQGRHGTPRSYIEEQDCGAITHLAGVAACCGLPDVRVAADATSRVPALADRCRAPRSTILAADLFQAPPLDGASRVSVAVQKVALADVECPESRVQMHFEL